MDISAVGPEINEENLEGGSSDESYDGETKKASPPLNFESARKSEQSNVNEAEVVHKTDPDDDGFSCPELPFSSNGVASRE